MSYVSHCAPDNASLITRLALFGFQVPFETSLVDRRIMENSSEAFLKSNPNRRIPFVETGGYALFKLEAILLWLVDQHGRLHPRWMCESSIFNVAILAVKYVTPHFADALLSSNISSPTQRKNFARQVQGPKEITGAFVDADRSKNWP